MANQTPIFRLLKLPIFAFFQYVLNFQGRHAKKVRELAKKIPDTNHAYKEHVKATSKSGKKFYVKSALMDIGSQEKKNKKSKLFEFVMTSSAPIFIFTKILPFP